MSTRSDIGIQNNDGTVTCIYCHFDGYPSNHVPILTEHYATDERVRALMALGDLSCLAPEIGEAHDFDARPAGVCNAYGRDRGESNTEARTFGTFRQFNEAATNDYAYLFRDGKWEARSCRGDWQLASMLLIADKAEQ